MGEEGEKGKAAEEGMLKEVWCTEEKHIGHLLDPPRHEEIF